MLWIVGKVFSDFQEYLEQNNLPYGVFVDSNKPVSLPENTPRITLDLSSRDAAISALEKLETTPEVTAIMTAGYEQYVIPAAWISEYFQVPGSTLEAAIAATDKATMREAFRRYAPEITPAYQTVSSWQDVESFMSTHDFPVMLKPTNLMKSLFVTQNNTLQELRDNFEHMTVELPKLREKLGLVDTPGILIEECMIGTMHTVAGFVSSTGEVNLLPYVADCVTAQNLGVSDNYLYSRQLPSSLPETDQEAIIDVAKKGVTALGVTTVPLHIEIILTKNGPKIIEIAARIGGYRGRMYAYAYGIDMYRASIDTACGRDLALKPNVFKSCAFIEVFPETAGTFVGITNTEELEKLPSLVTMSVKRKRGEPVGPAKQGFRAVMVIMLGHEEPTQVQRDAESIQKLINVVVE